MKAFLVSYINPTSGEQFNEKITCSRVVTGDFWLEFYQNKVLLGAIPTENVVKLTTVLTLNTAPTLKVLDNTTAHSQKGGS